LLVQFNPLCWIRMTGFHDELLATPA